MSCTSGGRAADGCRLILTQPWHQAPRIITLRLRYLALSGPERSDMRKLKRVSDGSLKQRFDFTLFTS
jgi:hypothetical protein